MITHPSAEGQAPQGAITEDKGSWCRGPHGWQPFPPQTSAIPRVSAIATRPRSTVPHHHPCCCTAYMGWWGGAVDPSATGPGSSAPIPATTSSSTLTPFHRLVTSHLISLVTWFCSPYNILSCLRNQTEAEQTAANTKETAKMSEFQECLLFFSHFQSVSTHTHPPPSAVPPTLPTCSRPQHAQ